MPSTIYFIRHGETDWNAEGRLQGQHDIPLNARGVAQAETAGRILARLVADPGRLPWLASPLARTRKTAEHARGALRLDPRGYETDARLMEIRFGDWEGLTWPEVTNRDPEGAAAREADKWGFRPPGGESYDDLVTRIAPFFDALEGDNVVIAHGGVARALVAHRCDVPPERAPHLDIWQGRVLVMQGRSYRWV
ncbi:MAG: histidine phosphatase family protein [Salinarimonas sp.]|nr:histidine phosphatase family protein [Salinarimonas sp.]